MDTQKMETFYKVAVVILNWNGKKLLEQFLPKVVEYNLENDCQIIVADNNSDDDSISFLEQNFPSVNIIPLEKNWGFAEGYNRALKQINAKYYIILNSDVEVSQNWISTIIKVMDDNPTIVAAQPKIKSFHKKSYFEHAGACGGFIDKLGYPFCRGRLIFNIEKDCGQYDNMIDIFWATGTAFFIRADIYQKLGGFDKFFHAHMEEIDLCWRIHNAGYRIVCVPQSTIYHIGGASLSYQSPRKTYLNFRNNLFMLYKNLPLKRLFKTLIIRFLLDSLVAISYLKKLEFANFFAVVRAYVIFPFCIRTLIKKRETIQNLVKPNAQPLIYPNSILWKYFAEKKKKFSELNY